MFGFYPLIAGSLLILASSGGGGICLSHKVTEVNVIPKTQDIKYDYSLTLDEMQIKAADIMTIDPYSFHSSSTTDGYMEGGIKMRWKVNFGNKNYSALGVTCLWYDTINIELELSPTIFIAQEVYQDPCNRKAVTEHEMKHVMVDRKIVNKYSKIIGNKVLSELKQRGFHVGPIKSQYAQQTVDRMQRTVDQIVNHEYEKMKLERIDLQRAVDSLEEYERVGALCP